MPDCSQSGAVVRRGTPRTSVLLGLFGALAFIAAAGVPAIAQDCGHHHHSYDYDDGWHCDRYWYGGRASGNPARGGVSLQTVQGRIAGIVYQPGSSPDSAMVELRLVAAGQTQHVQLAPIGFLKQGGILLKDGDTVTIRGSVVSTFDGEMIAAASIQKGDRSLALRDSRGWPLW